MTELPEREWRAVSEAQAERAMALPPLGADVEYSQRGGIGVNKLLVYERSVFEWLKTSKPGSFHSRDVGVIYRKAHRLFTAEWSDKLDHANSIDDFEICLSRLGYRCGVLVHQGRSLWLLILPSAKTTPAKIEAEEKSLDQAFKDLIAREENLSAEQMDSLLEILATREAS